MGRRSDIDAVPVERLAAVTAAASTFTEILDQLGLKKSGSKYAILKRRLAATGIDTAHIPRGYGRTVSNLNRQNGRYPLEQVMVEGSSYSRWCLKRQLIDKGVLPYECQECGAPPVWRGRPLVLVLDHINGVRDDHRKENLRFLCPNCNSQTATFSGRNKGKRG